MVIAIIKIAVGVGVLSKATISRARKNLINS